MSRYRSEAKQKPELGTSTELQTPTEYPSNSTELTIGKNVSTGPIKPQTKCQKTPRMEKRL